MSRMAVLRWGLIIVIFMVANGIVGLAINGETFGSSDGRSLRWDRFDVTIDNFNTNANQFVVTEDYTITVDTGPFSYGFAEIPLDRVESISNVTVYENNVPLTRSCNGARATACVQDDGKLLSIQYYFVSPVQSRETRRITLEYTVTGALRSYAKGDELFWVALPEDLSFPVESSRVTVNLPATAPALAATSYPDTWDYSASGNTLTWVSPPRPSDDGMFEVRVKIPHNPIMPKPSWQAGFDRETWYIDNVQPIVTLLAVIVAGLLGIGGTVFVVLRYQRQGRDPKTVTVPDYLDKPPSIEAPGVVGLLLDEKADMRDIMGTLIDLARRGYFVIEQTQESTFGLFKKTGFTFHRTDKSADGLRGFESTLLRGLFPKGRKETDLDDLKQKFYTHIPAIKKQMYGELVRAKYFERSPDTTRTIWWTIGGVGLALAAGGFWVGLSVDIMTLITPVAWLPALGLGIVAATALLFADAMPAKTERGAQQAALWRAFKRYLENIRRFTDVDDADQRFEQYMPYAVAFGVEDDFVRDIAPVLTSMPTWYHPTYLGGPWHGGYRPGRYHPTSTTMTGGGLGNFPSGGDFSAPNLESLNRSLGEGLNAMSKGMTQMLNDASKAMTSRPQSSGSGGGGFSGGGGGGGSGGGSRGFG